MMAVHWPYARGLASAPGAGVAAGFGAGAGFASGVGAAAGLASGLGTGFVAGAGLASGFGAGAGASAGFCSGLEAACPGWTGASLTGGGVFASPGLSRSMNKTRP